MRATALNSWGTALLLAVLLAAVVASGVNLPLFLAINRATAVLPDLFWIVLTHLGDSAVVIALALFFAARRPKIFFALCLAALFSALVVHGLKESLDAARPPRLLPAGSFHLIGEAMISVSFPSGHSTTAMVFVATLLMLLPLRWFWRVALLALVLGVGVSRIAIGVHWPQDVLGGFLVGWLCALGAVGLVTAPRFAVFARWGESAIGQRLWLLIAGLDLIVLLWPRAEAWPQMRAAEILLALVALLVSLRAWIRLGRTMQQERQAAAASTATLTAMPGDEPQDAATEGMEEILATDAPRHKLRTALIAALQLGVTALVFTLLLRHIGLDKAVAAWSDAVPRLLVLGLVAQIAASLLAAWRWQRLLGIIGLPRPTSFCLASSFKAAFLGQVLPAAVGSDAIRLMDCAQTGMRKRDALASLVLDRGLGLAGALLASLLSLAFAVSLDPPMPRATIWLIALPCGAGLLAFTAFAFWHRLQTRLMPLLSRFLPRALLLPLQSLQALSELWARLFASLRSWLWQISFLLGIPLLSTLAFFLVGRSLGLNFSLTTYLALTPCAFLLMSLPISIAGWGVREGVLVALFHLVGADTTLVLSASVLFGLQSILATLPGLIIYLRNRRMI